MGPVIVRAGTSLRNEIESGHHRLIADEPVDAGGLSLAGDPAADLQAIELANDAQNLREQGQLLREYSAEERTNAQQQFTAVDRLGEEVVRARFHGAVLVARLVQGGDHLGLGVVGLARHGDVAPAGFFIEGHAHFAPVQQPLFQLGDSMARPGFEPVEQ